MPTGTDGNVLSPNDINGVWLLGNNRTTDLHLERLNVGTATELNTYQIDNTLTMAAGAKLTVAAGVIVKFGSGGNLNVNGALDAQGTAADPVVFTSYRDDVYGGDFNHDGAASSPRNGDWGNIYFTNQADDANCVIDHAVIRYGGSVNSSQLYANDTDFTISNSVISNSSMYGI